MQNDRNSIRQTGRPSQSERYSSGRREPPRSRENDSGRREPPRSRENNSGRREPPRNCESISGRKEPPRSRENDSGRREPPRSRENDSGRREPPRSRTDDSGRREPPHANVQGSGEKEIGNRAYSLFCLAFCLAFFAFITGVAILGIKTPDREKSESENRMLRQLPTATWGTITDGSYMRDLETYLTDQFPYRDQLVAKKTLIDMMTGKQRINGVYLGSDSYLFDGQSKADEDDLSNKLNSIVRFCTYEENAKCCVAIVPNATYVLADKRPYGAPFDDQGKRLQQINEILIRSSSQSGAVISPVDCAAPLMKELDFQKYYRTDHHWTTRSAYEVFGTIASALSLDTSGVNYEFATVSDSFQGTLASSSGLHHIKDSIEICWPKDFSGKYVIEYEAEQVKRTSFFVSEKLSGKNQYEVFMGGNFGKIIISSDTTRKKNLLLIKDSYANCVIPMLVPYFSKIVVIDPRYLNDDLSDVIQDYSFTHILFLYNLNTFLDDTSLVDAISIRLPSAEAVSNDPAD